MISSSPSASRETRPCYQSLTNTGAFLTEKNSSDLITLPVKSDVSTENNRGPSVDVSRSLQHLVTSSQYEWANQLLIRLLSNTYRNVQLTTNNRDPRLRGGLTEVRRGGLMEVRRGGLMEVRRGGLMEVRRWPHGGEERWPHGGEEVASRR